MFLHLAAYDKRQQKKRSEISRRSWFSQGSDVKTQTANNSLKNLTIRPKPPPVRVESALKLGVVRRESKEMNNGGKTGSLTLACRLETREDSDLIEPASERNTETSPPVTTPEDGPPKQPATSSCLVVDYSDSSTESE